MKLKNKIGLLLILKIMLANPVYCGEPITANINYSYWKNYQNNILELNLFYLGDISSIDVYSGFSKKFFNFNLGIGYNMTNNSILFKGALMDYDYYGFVCPRWEFYEYDTGGWDTPITFVCPKEYENNVRHNSLSILKFNQCGIYEQEVEWFKYGYGYGYFGGDTNFYGITLQQRIGLTGLWLTENQRMDLHSPDKTIFGLDLGAKVSFFANYYDLNFFLLTAEYRTVMPSANFQELSVFFEIHRIIYKPESNYKSDLSFHISPGYKMIFLNGEHISMFGLNAGVYFNVIY